MPLRPRVTQLCHMTDTRNVENSYAIRGAKNDRTYLFSIKPAVTRKLYILKFMNRQLKTKKEYLVGL